MSQGFYPGLFSISDGLHKPVPAGNLLSDMFNSQAIDFAAGYSSSNSYEPGMPLPADPAAKSTAQNYNFQGLNAADAALFLLNPHQLNPSGYNFIYLGNSLYAGAAQELLEEFCCVLREKVRAGGARGKRQPAVISGKREDNRKESPIHRFELERKKVRLLEMVDQIHRRYQRYCNQMKAVVSSFDSIMGMGAASPYTFLAQKAMSRHFRALKDAVSAQLRKTCLLLGEKDGGLTKGETPRLRLLEQNLWKRRSLGFDQEMWRPPRGLPDRSVKILRAWLFEHFLHPYPTDPDKDLLARQTGLSRSQVSNWFINARVRLWKPMVEEMYQREVARAQDSCGGSSQSQQHQVLREASAAPPLIAVGSSSAGDVSLTLGCRPASQGVSVEEL